MIRPFFRPQRFLGRIASVMIVATAVVAQFNWKPANHGYEPSITAIACPEKDRYVARPPEVSAEFSQDPEVTPTQATEKRNRQRIELSKLHALTRKLKPLHQPMGAVQPGDWLAHHPEKGQTFRQYLNSRPVRITPQRNVLFVLPLGDFNAAETKILQLSSEYLGLYFDCRVKQLEPLKLNDVIPPDARRVHPNWGVRQIKSTYILEKVLPPRLPNDGVALICFTTSDLYPDENWNFVFGQAMLKARVGVWSMHRNGNAEEEFELCLRRTLKVATHETGHMFSMNHCIAYECNLCGSNSLAESDRRPLYPCPECEAKISYATASDTIKRFESLLQFCRQHQLEPEAEYYAKAIEALR